MKFAILDACFPITNQHAVGMAATYLKWKFSKAKIAPVACDQADIILITIVDPRQENYIARVRQKYKTARIYVGGAGALSPYTPGMHCDAICVGNGDRFIDTLIKDGPDRAEALPEAWIHKGIKKVDVADGFPWECPPIQGEDGAFRVWCGKGCKKKCYFCQTGWAIKYEENPDPYKMILQIADLKKAGKKVAYLSNDPLQHSFYFRLPKVDHGSYSLEYMKKHGLPSARQIRIGIEGVSERLRKSVNKPLSNEDLMNSAVWLNRNHKSVRWFLIAGLPSENDSDWEELRSSVSGWKKLSDKGVIALSFTAWQPEPASPLAIMPLDDSYWERFEAFSEWFFAGRGWSNRIKIMKPAQPQSRLKASMARMGLSKNELKKGGNWGPNARVNYPYRDAAVRISQR